MNEAAVRGPSADFACIWHEMAATMQNISLGDVSMPVHHGRGCAARVDIWTVASLAMFGQRGSNGEGWASMDSMLSPGEMERASRFCRWSDRQTYKMAHSALRIILASYLDCAPLEVLFANGVHGKPLLRNMPGIHFNISHSGGVAVVAVSKDFEVGVDIEKVEGGGMREPFEMAENFLSEAEFQWIRERDADERFLRCWCLREAAVKSIGTGLFMPLEDFFVIPPDSDASRPAFRGIDVEAVEFIPLPGYVGALAASTPRDRVQESSDAA